MNSSAVQHLWWPADEKITRPAESDSSSKIWFRALAIIESTQESDMKTEDF
jgi:hypothetical protein